ncbi:MAG: hypothetical protein WCS96_09830 [Victivallales bacterium]
MAEEEIFYFDGQEGLNSVFAGNISKNLKLIEKELDVHVASRDLWVKIISENSSALSIISSFIKELISLQNEGGGISSAAEF